MITKLQILPIFVCLSLWSCQSEQPKPRASRQAQNDLKKESHDQDASDQAFVDFSSLKDAKGSGSWTNRFWLNFEGATVTADDSFIVKEQGAASLVVPPFKVESLGETGAERPEAIKDISDRAAALFNGYEISFTTTKPSSGGFSVIHVGGTDFRSKGALGVAPHDIDNFAGKDIGFAFPEGLTASRGKVNRAILANVIAHEIAHALGASHISNKVALMNPTVDIDNNLLGTNGPIVPGPGTENTADLLRQNIGLAKHNDTKILPKIVRLSFSTQGNVRQYTLYNKENVETNPDRNLGLYKYSWQTGDVKVEGSNARIPIEKLKDNIVLTVSNTTETKTFTFAVEK